MKTEVIETKYGDIEYNIYGEGEPILFIHGGHSNANETLTHKFISPKKYTLVTPSRPGSGKTPLLNNTTALKSAKLIIELIKYLGFEKFNVIGISAGGLTAITLVKENPKRVLKFIMASSISKRWLMPNNKLYRKAKIIFNPKVEKYIWYLLKFSLKISPVFLIKQISKELTTIKIKEINENEIEDMKALLLNQSSKEGFIADLEHDIEKGVLEQITTPTLILHSKNDNSISKGHPNLANKTIKTSELIWVDNKWGHLIWVGKEAKEIIDNINKFLDE